LTTWRAHDSNFQVFGLGENDAAISESSWCESEPKMQNAFIEQPSEPVPDTTTTTKPLLEAELTRLYGKGYKLFKLMSKQSAEDYKQPQLPSKKKSLLTDAPTFQHWWFL